MKIIQITLLLIGVCVSNVTYGLSPEFYGYYAEHKSKLVEMAANKNNTDPYEFDQQVRFLVFQKHAEVVANSLTIKRAIFVRTVDNPGMDGRQPPKRVDEWRSRTNGAIETRTKPVPGQVEQIYLVPREPLSAGMYIVKVGHKEIAKFFVDKNGVTQNLVKGSDCIDIKVRSGWKSYEYDLGGKGGEEIPCSKSTLGAIKNPKLDAELFQAVNSGDLDKVKSLIASGADVNANDDYNASSVLSYATNTDRLDMTKLLVENGANVNAMSSGDPSSPEFFQAASIKMIMFFLEKGVDVNVKNSRGSTILHGSGLPEMEFVISKGGDVNAKNSFGQTPLSIAMSEKKYLDESKAKGEEVSGGEERIKNNELVIKLLLRNGGK